MRSQWNFYFESKGLFFDQAHKYEGTIESEQAVAFGFAPEEFSFLLFIEPDPEPKIQGMQQTGTLKITLPGDMEQTKDLAYWIATHSSESISFSKGELKLLGGLITGEYLPDSPEEEKKLGDGRHFAIAHLVQYSPPPTFDGDSFTRLSSCSTAGTFVQQFNAAIKAKNPIDIFLGLFKIIEDFYGPKTKKETLAQALKGSNELFTLATTYLKLINKDNSSKALTEDDFSKLVDDLVKTRHNCAHLKTTTGFGIPHGDPRVDAEVRPLIGPLKTLTYKAISQKVEDQTRH